MKLAGLFVVVLISSCARETELQFDFECRIHYSLSVDENDVVAIAAGRLAPLRASGCSMRMQDQRTLLISFEPPLDADERASLERHLSGAHLFEIAAVLHRDMAGFDYDAEFDRFRVWREAHHDEPVVNFNRLSEQDGGPSLGLRWYARAPARIGTPQPLELLCIDARAAHVGREWSFALNDVARFEPCFGSSAQPALYFELVESRAPAFREFTEHYLDRQIALIIDGTVVSAPVIGTPLSSGVPIEVYGWTEEERDRALHQLRLGIVPVTFEVKTPRTPR